MKINYIQVEFYDSEPTPPTPIPPTPIPISTATPTPAPICSTPRVVRVLVVVSGLTARRWRLDQYLLTPAIPAIKTLALLHFGVALVLTCLAQWLLNAQGAHQVRPMAGQITAVAITVVQVLTLLCWLSLGLAWLVWYVCMHFLFQFLFSFFLLLLVWAF